MPNWFMPPMFVRNNYYMQQDYGCHHHCGSNWLNTFMGFGLINQMMSNIFRPSYSPYTTYPGTTLERTVDPDIINLKMLYPGWNFVKMENGDYCCTTPDGALLTAPSANELLKKIDEHRENSRVSDTEPVDDEEETQPAEFNPEGWGTVRAEWFQNNFTNNNITKPTVDQIIEKLWTGNATNAIDLSTLPDEQKANLKADLIDANKELFDSDGNPKADFDSTKLKVPMKENLKSDYGAKTRLERDYVLYMNCNNGMAMVKNPLTGTYRKVRYTAGQEASAAENLKQALLAEGFKDVTIKCPNVNSDKVSNNKFDKTAKYYLMFAYKSTDNGTGFVYLPNGEKYELTDLNTRHGNDKSKMIAEIKRNLSNMDWTNLDIR